MPRSATEMLDLPLSQCSDAFACLASVTDDAGVVRTCNGPARVRLPAGWAVPASFGSITAVPRVTRALVTNRILSPDSWSPSSASNGLTSADMGWFPHP